MAGGIHSDAIMSRALAEHDAGTRMKKKQAAEAKVQLLEVCAAELKSVKKTRDVYELQGGVYYLSSKPKATANLKKEIAEAKEDRDSYRVHSGVTL